MKLSIKFLAITVLICLLSVAGFAQNRDSKSFSPEQRAEKQTTQMTEKLRLDEKQANTVSAINLFYANKLHQLREKKRDNKEAAKELKIAIKAEKTAEMEQILTADQFGLYTKMEARIKGNKGRKNKGIK